MVVAHIFNSSREVETKSDMVGQREEYKAGEDMSSASSLRFCTEGCSVWAFSLRTCREETDFVEVRTSN